MQGNILGSRYRVIEYIAKGGFGKTFLAEDIQLPGKDRCVVKQLFPSVDDPNFIKVARRLFKTEAETLNTLGVHNQIPRLMAYFEEDEKFYLVQEYIEGHTLSKELVSGEAWSEDKVVDLLKDCLGILVFIHGESVIHRDVKPDNLIRRQSDNKLVLVDFGTVKEVIAEQTQLIPATVAVGTRGYMPTEQARGKPRTTSDIYALGVIAIQALTGVHPTQLQEDDNGEIVWKDKAQCSPKLEEIVAKMTRYHFKERHQSAAEAIAALNSLSGTPAKSVTPVTPAMEYTPTLSLSDTQLAEMSKRREATAMEASALASDRSVVETPQNLTNFSAEPLSGIAENALSSQLPADPVENEANSMSNASKSHKNLITLGIALAIGALASGGMYLLNQRTTQSAQKNIEEQVNEVLAMVAKENYQACYDKVIALNPEGDEATNSMPIDKQREFEAQCGLGTAQAAADDLKYDEALAIAVTLPKAASMDAEVQESIDTWSQQLLDKANKLYEQEGDLEKAIEIVKQIPQNSSVRPQVIDAKNFWKEETKANEAIITAAQKALSQEKWRYAKQEATKVQESSKSEYWQEQANKIVAQAESALAEASPAPKPEPAKAIAPKPETESDPVPTTTKIEPVAPINPPVTTKSNPVTQPQPKPTVRVDQGSAGELRDLGGSSQSSPTPSNSTSPSKDSLRDL